MISRAATLEPDGQLESQPTVAAPRGSAMKFLYASGARPLDGFTIKRGIGRGGFGEVYFAASDAGKELALKHIERNLEVELRGVSQCLNLKHPNLIDLYDIRYDEQGDAWVVMEYVAGASLKETIDRNPNGLPLELALHWFRGIAAGTAYLHDHGIVHRDLKPGNIFEDVGLVKIGDYGLSKFISTSRRSGQTESVGTFHYMAPEIGKGIYGKEIDIYALGIILFEMLTGRVPFDGESSQEIIMKHLTADPDLSGVPQPYRAIIERTLQKDPDKRFASVHEMLAALTPSAFPLAGGKPASGNVAGDFVPKLFGASPLIADPPLYIGDENEGIELGPLHVDTEKLAKLSPVRANGHALPVRPQRAVGEPVAHAVGRGCRGFAHWWNNGPLTTLAKIVLIVLVVPVAIFYGGWLLPVALALGCVYIVYLGLRLLIGALTSSRAEAGSRAGETPAPQGPQGAAAAMPRSPGWHPLSWEKQGRALLCEKTAGDRVGELTGSMLMAAAVAGILTVLMTAIGGESLGNSAQPLAGPAWLWLATTLGSWIVLSAGKFCERSSGEAVKRRFLMLTLGLAFGALAYLLGQFLMVQMNWTNPTNLSAVQTTLAYFGAMFATVGWWKLTDPLRSSRFKIGPILIAIVAAWLWHLVLPFPQPWGFMVMAAIAITAQLSAPWLSLAERTAAIAKRAPTNR